MGIEFDVAPPVEIDRGESDFDDVVHRMQVSGGENIVVRSGVLERQPHAMHVIASVAPVALGAGVAQRQFGLPAGLDGGGGAADLAGHEVFTSAG